MYYLGPPNVDSVEVPINKSCRKAVGRDSGEECTYGGNRSNARLVLESFHDACHYCSPLLLLMYRVVRLWQGFDNDMRRNDEKVVVVVVVVVVVEEVE